jgi:two-component system CheB/CheR fusion protein
MSLEKPDSRQSQPRKSSGTKAARPSKRAPRSVVASGGTPALIVGIGASAGGLDAFRTFFTNMPADSGMAFVLVQHLSPDHKSLLADLVGNATAMSTVEAQDRMRIAANQIYVIPPDATLTVKDRRLRVVMPAPPREHRRPIDTFFSSLAEDQGENAVCIVLSGTGSDGALGLTAIKEYGGLTLAQAEFDHSAMSGMPHSAAATGFVDHVMPVEKMPARLVEYQRHLSEVAGQKDPEGIRGDASAHLATISTLLRTRIGHDFSQYKEKTLVRRIQRRMQVLRIDTVPAYIARLREEPGETELLFRELLIGVTQFFRDPDAFEALQATAIPKLLDSRSADDPVRIWVPACATGEEVYSIAILVREEMERRGTILNVQVFGTDIDDKAVTIARAGRYRMPLTGISPRRNERWFTEEGDERCPIRAVREMCVFSTHSVVKDPPFSKLDLISCRNLLIYLDADLQDRVVQTFHYALRPGGTLFLGSSEGLSHNGRLFAALDKKHRIFQRRDAEMILPRLPTTAGTHGHPATAARPIPSGDDRIERSAHRALEKYSPVYVVIDRRHEILRFSGSEIGHYLGPSPGSASLHLFDILRKPLRSAVRAALQAVSIAKKPVVQEGVALKIEGRSRTVTVIVAPLTEGEAEADLCVVAFQDAGSLAARKHAESGDKTTDGQVQALEQELRTTKTQLQAAIDEFEIVNEEMKSANEEYQSVNEELQSSNEELETAKEEMQSVNEELQTINTEMVGKNDLLTRLNSDLKNLFESTEIATIFLDNDLRIKSFTPTMTELFHLRDADRGRPITDIVTLLSYGELQRDVRAVMRKLSPIEREVAIPDNDATFIMRVRPYRTVDNVIDGVVITFVDISERKRVEEVVSASEALYRTLFDLGPLAIYSCDAAGVIQSFNRRAAELWGRTPAPGDTDERFCGSHKLFRPDGSFMPHDQCPMAEVVSGKISEARDAEVLIERPDGSRIVVVVNIRPLKNQRGEITGAVNCFYDITERKHAEVISASLAAIVESSDDAIIGKDLTGIITSWNIGAERLFGYTSEEAVGRSITMLIPPDRAQEETEILARLRRGERMEHFETVRVRKDGSPLELSLTISPIKDSAGRVIGASKIARDISQRRRAELHQQLLVNELNHRVKNTLAAVQSIAAQSLKGALDVEHRKTFEARLVALARTHDLLSQGSWENVSLRHVLLQELAPYRSDEGTRFVVEGPDLTLNPKAALALGMAFHELATNAAKYGALSKTTGRIRVTWDILSNSEPSAIQLKWIESGGPPVQHTGRKGFGSTVIERGLSLELDGEIRIDLEPRGVVCTMQIPLAAVTGERVSDAR